MSHRIIPYLCALLFLLPACSGKEALPAPVPPAPKETTPPPKVPAPAAPTMDIGDVESYLHFTLVPTPESASDQVKITTMKNKVYGVDMVTVDIHPPYPKELWLDCTVKAHRSFKSQPILLQGTVVREKDIIGSVKGVMGIDQIVSTTATASSRIDALIGLNATEGSVLIHGEAEAFLMPEGTDAEALDKEDSHPAPTAKTVLLSNPLRINFLKE